MKKPFDIDLYRADDDAKLDVLNWFNKYNSKPSHINPDKYGVDIITPWGSVEVEVKHNWSGYTFPFESLHLPGRKMKFAKLGATFVVLNHEHTLGLVVDGATVVECPVITKNTKYSAAEQFIDVDLYKCFVIHLDRSLNDTLTSLEKDKAR
jgi:hypothetical protein